MPKIRYWQLLFLLTALVIILNVVVVIYSLARVSQTQDAVQQARQIMMTIRATYSAIQDVEISERDYLLWNNEDAQQIYRDSVAKVVEGVQRIRTSQYDGHTFAKLVGFESLLMRRLHVSSLDELSFPYAGTPSSLETWSIPENAALLQEIRSTILDIEQSYGVLLSSRNGELEASERNISIAVSLVTTLGVLGIALMYRALKRSLARQQRWETELLQQKQALEDMVASRTAALQFSNRELERSNRELEDFAFIASHDLQEPLRKILAFGDRLKARSGDALGENVDYLNRMQSAAARMSMLIQDLLEFSRVTAKPKEFEQVSLNAVLAGVLEDLEESINASKTSIRADPLPDIQADSTQMRQLLLNLISNAIKFVSVEKTPEVRITANTKLLSVPATLSDQEFLELHVIDNGIGFDSKYTERIFTPFQRLHSRSEYTGTGIGLALCRRIVERHSGELIASSKVGHGTDFTVILPVRHESPDVDTASESLPPGTLLQESNQHAS
tara:strand:+ start:205973 stop:207481 length:1509 start_codon:yes stop_codon:yes gene_type:complete